MYISNSRKIITQKFLGSQILIKMKKMKLEHLLGGSKIQRFILKIKSVMVDWL